jgi:endonuclease/exonuclease/phosphatase family metal-dependent hydrolase
MAWPTAADDVDPERLTVDVVSVHFDYLSRTVRERQLQELARILGARENPRIVLGDFNSGWSAPDSTVRRLAQLAGLQTFRPLAKDLNTYGDTRIDWILVSPAFRFDHYAVLPDVVSDHRAVIADISLRTRDRDTAAAD